MLETTGLAFRSLSTDSAADIWLIRRENMDFVTNAVDALQARVLVQYMPDSGLPFVDGGGVVLPTNFAASRTTAVVASLFRNPPPRSPPSALPPRSERHPPHSHASRDPGPPASQTSYRKTPVPQNSPRHFWEFPSQRILLLDNGFVIYCVQLVGAIRLKRLPAHRFAPQNQTGRDHNKTAGGRGRRPRQGGLSCVQGGIVPRNKTA